MSKYVRRFWLANDTRLDLDEDHHGGLDPYPHVDAGELFDFITDFSFMPDKPRVVSFQMFDNGAPIRNPLEERFNENVASIGGQVCAMFSGYMDHNWEYRYLTNMASEDQKETLWSELYRKITYYTE